MIRRLTGGDAEAYAMLRRASLLDTPLAFTSSPGDDRVSSATAVRTQLALGPDSVIFGAFDPDLVGAAGLYRDAHLKARHKAHLWGMYVAPGHRGRGLGGALLAAVVAHARSLPGVSRVLLTVSEEAVAARTLYERAGFRLWGTEPDALRHEGRSVVDHHLALALDVGTSDVR